MKRWWLSIAAAAAMVTATGAHGLELDGAFTQGGMIRGQVEPGQTVRLNGEPVKVSADGAFVIGFGREADAQHTLSVRAKGEVVAERRLTIEARDFEIERVDGLEEDKVSPPPEYYERRERETGMVSEARAPVSAMTHWQDGFIWPATGEITGVYGSQRILNGKPRAPHYGVDIAGGDGSPVKAPAGGLVRLAETDFLLEGGIVIIDHGFGVSSTLFHLKAVTVAEGERVEQGARIGRIGATGRATGPHVDWRVNWRETRLDPRLLAGPMDPKEASR